MNSCAPGRNCLRGIFVVFAFVLGSSAAFIESGRAQEPRLELRYPLGPDSLRQEGVPRGKVTEHVWKDSKVFPGTIRRYYVYVPEQYDAAKPAALMVFQDGHAYIDEDGDFRVPMVFDNLIHKGEMPVTIGVFVDPGHKKSELPPERGWRPQPENRSFEYDTLSGDYAEFLLTEILPEVAKEHPYHRRPGRPCDLRHVERRNLCVHRRLGAARCVSQSSEPHRQLHQHPRRRPLPRHDPQGQQETADAHLPAGRQQRPRQRARQLAARQPADVRGAEVPRLRREIRLRRRRPQRQPRRGDSARFAALAVAQITSYRIEPFTKIILISRRGAEDAEQSRTFQTHLRPLCALRERFLITDRGSSMRSLLPFALVLSLLWQVNADAAARNVVLFVTDDQGQDAGCYGNPVIKTPNLDALAADGTRFTHAYCTTASCSPSRSVILTGLFNHANGQYGLEQRLHHFRSFENVKSLPVRLAQAGYRTARIGKFHVGPESVYRFDEQLPGNPRNRRGDGRALPRSHRSGLRPALLFVFLHGRSASWRRRGRRNCRSSPTGSATGRTASRIQASSRCITIRPT